MRDKLKERNGFYWGGYNFYCVYDEADKFHTFDDVVRENENDSSGWKKYLPEGYVAIASDDGYGLLLKTDKDGIVYYFDTDTGLIEPFSASEEELESKLDEADREMEEEPDQE